MTTSIQVVKISLPIKLLNFFPKIIPGNCPEKTIDVLPYHRAEEMYLLRKRKKKYFLEKFIGLKRPESLRRH